MRTLFRIAIFTLCAACTSHERFDAEKISIVKSYRPDGRLYATVAYVNNKPHGKGLQYHPNQKLYIDAEYRNGFKHGVAKQYYQNGVLYSETPLRMVKLTASLKNITKTES